MRSHIRYRVPVLLPDRPVALQLLQCKPLENLEDQGSLHRSETQCTWKPFGRFHKHSPQALEEVQLQRTEDPSAERSADEMHIWHL